MRLNEKQLASHLDRTLAPVYLVASEEPLLVQEAAAAIRRRAREEGYEERQVLNVEPGFDWERLHEAGSTMSLFASRRLLELRLPTGKPGEAGSRALVRYCENLPQDTVLLVLCGKLESNTLRSKWVKRVEGAGVLLTAYLPEAREYPRWIARRMQLHGLEPGPGVVEALAYHFEGNLLALNQEIEKLAMVAQGTVNEERVLESLSDSARFTVYVLVDTCLAGKAPEARRILRSLHAEGTAPALASWALAREIRTLTRLAAEAAAGTRPEALFRRYGVWPRRQALVRQALGRLSPGRARRLLQQAAHTDRVVKGRAPGEPWQALERLSLMLSGVAIGPFARERPAPA